MGRLEHFARNTDPLVRDLREPADDLAPTVRDLGDLSPDLEQLFNDVGPLVDASATGVPAATRFLRGAEPVLASTHTFMRQLNPILSYLSFGAQPAQRVHLGARRGDARRDGRRRLPGNGAGEHYLNQLAVIDERSLLQRTQRPPWDRGNAYVAPNAYARATRSGVIESFDCTPAGGEQRNPSGSGGTAAPPCFVAPRSLFQDQKYPRLRAGHAPVVDAPRGHPGQLAGHGPRALARRARPPAGAARRSWRGPCGSPSPRGRASPRSTATGVAMCSS